MNVGQKLHVVMTALALRAIAHEERGEKRDADWHGGLADRVSEVLDDLGYPHERPQRAEVTAPLEGQG